jgi:hypothetical protein
MSQWIVAVWLAAALACAGGCKETKSTSSTPADGAGDHAEKYPSSPPTASRLWTQSEVDAWIRDDLGLVDLSLTPSGAGKFTGTGRDEAGRPYTLIVTQKPGQIRCDHKSPPQLRPASSKAEASSSGRPNDR